MPLGCANTSFKRVLRAGTRSLRNEYDSLEELDSREVPAIITFKVNVFNDTHRVMGPAGFGFNAATGQMAPLDATGNTSLRAVVEYANANPLNGIWALNHYVVDLGMIPGTVMVLTTNSTIPLNTNFDFVAGNGPVTIARAAAPNTPVFNHFDITAGAETHFLNLIMTNGKSNVSGGSIDNRGAAYFQDCTFTNNSTTADGGAIINRSNGFISLQYCTLTDNSADGNGGAVAGETNSVGISLGNCSLTQNSAVGQGGAVWSQGNPSLSISGSTITNNRVTGFVGTQGLGGGVYVETVASVSINNSSINNNSAAWQGGGLYVLDSAVTMNSGSLSYNTSANDGGGFYINAYGKTVTLTQVSVTQNTATNGKGGGGYLWDGTLDGSLAALTGNTAGGGLAGIAKKTGSFSSITVPAGQQTVILDP